CAWQPKSVLFEQRVLLPPERDACYSYPSTLISGAKLAGEHFHHHRVVRAVPLLVQADVSAHPGPAREFRIRAQSHVYDSVEFPSDRICAANRAEDDCARPRPRRIGG